nr:MAG TPA: hypothetical protein [Caudoviricetes sp.]
MLSSEGLKLLERRRKHTQRRMCGTFPELIPGDL